MISGCAVLTDKGFGSLRNLQNLDLISVPSITGKFYLKKLKTVEIDSCRAVCSGGLETLLDCAKILESLTIIECFDVDKDELVEYAMKSRNPEIGVVLKLRMDEPPCTFKADLLHVESI